MANGFGGTSPNQLAVDAQEKKKKKPAETISIADDFGGAINQPRGGALPPAPAPAPAATAQGTSGPAPSGPSDPNFWVTLPNGDRVPWDHPLASTPGTTGPGGGGGGGGRGGLPMASDITVTGPAGTATLSTSADGVTTGQSPEIPLGSTLDDDPVNQLLRSRLLELLDTDLTVDINQPELSRAAQAYSGARQREQQRQQQAAFERLAAGGVSSSGAADAAVARGAEAAGEDIANFESRLVIDELANRRDLLVQGAQIAATIGMAAEANNLARQIQGFNGMIQFMQLAQTDLGRQATLAMAQLNSDDRRYLAELDADLREKGLATTERLAIMEDATRRYGIDVGGNLGIIQAMTDLIGLEQQNIQFNDQLGFNYWRSIQDINMANARPPGT